MPDAFRIAGLVGRPGDRRVEETLASLAAYLADRGMTILMAETSDGAVSPAGASRVSADVMVTRADLVIAVGGDGTMLHAARLIADRSVPLLGINRGRLGFLADISPVDMTDRLDEILAGNHVAERRSLLGATLIDAAGASRTGLALNDVVLQRLVAGRMLEFETRIDGRFVNVHGGDGLIIATPTGSTAYALSAGGPILSPELSAMVIAPICPHTLSDRPVVVGGDATVETRLIDRGDTSAQVVCDGVVLGNIEAGDALTVSRSPATVTLLHPRDYDYYKILRSKLKWGRGSTGRPDDNDRAR